MKIFSLLVFTALLTSEYANGQEVDEIQPIFYPTGLSIDPRLDTIVAMIEKYEGFGMDLPEEMSLEAFVPFVRSQELPISGGWAAAYYTATTEWALLTNQSNKSIITAYAYDPLYLNAKASETPTSCDGTVYLTSLASELIINGAKRFNIDKVDCSVNANYNEKQSLMGFTKVNRLTDLELSWEENAINIKQAITNYHPVLFGMSIPESFFMIGEDGLFDPSAFEKETADAYLGHAMTLVGFDDNQFGGAFRVVNSWGDTWGDQGYCWIRYEDFNTFLVAAYSFQTELKRPDMVSSGADADGFGRKRVKKYGFFEGFLDEKGRPDKGVYINEKLKKGRGGSRYMRRLIKKHDGFLIYDNDNFKIPIAAILY